MRNTIGILLIALAGEALPAGESLLAQVAVPNAAVCPAVTGPPYLPCQVDVRPVLIDSLRHPGFPLVMYMNGVEGQLLAQFVIDTSGAVSASSLMVLRSDHQDFEQSLREVLPAFRYAPGIRGNIRVPVLQRELFVLAYAPSPGGIVSGITPTDKDGNAIRREAAARDTIPDGTPRTRISLLAHDETISRVTSEDFAKAGSAVFNEVLKYHIGRLTDSTATLTACVTMRVTNNAAKTIDEDVRRLATKRVRVVLPTACPPTYTVMFIHLDENGRRVEPVAPQGYVDPIHVTLTAELGTANQIYFSIKQSQGTAFQENECGARRTSTGWIAACYMRVMGVH